MDLDCRYITNVSYVFILLKVIGNMTNNEFEEKMKDILKKADLNLFCSADPDIVADIGCDLNGYLVIMGETFPLKIKDITSIRYRPGSHNICRFLRLDFGKNIYLGCHYDDFNFGRAFSVRYHDKNRVMINMQDTIGFFEDVLN